MATPEQTPDDALPDGEDIPDCRLYVPDAKGWKIQILSTWEKFYCFGKNPGEDFHHAILFGEIYLRQGDEIYCLRCARRRGIITTDRLFWQHQAHRQSSSGLI